MDKITLDEAIERVKDLMSVLSRSDNQTAKDDAKAISIVLKELRSATNCQECDGTGKRWYSFYGMGSCERCKGSGYRQ